MHNRVLSLGVVLAVAGMFGCSSGSSSTNNNNDGSGSGGAAAGGGTGGASGGGAFTTSVNSGTKLNNLSTSQATQLCKDVNNYYEKTLTPDLCKVLALEGAIAKLLTNASPTSAQLQAACTDAYNSCLSGGDGGVALNGGCDPATVSANPATCTATVGDVSTCLNDDVASFHQLSVSYPSCSQLTTVADLTSVFADAGDGPAEPASCSMFNAQCDGVSMSGMNTKK